MSRLGIRLSVPIGLLGITASVLGIVFEDSIYGQETAAWAAQCVGQDIANLVAFPVLLVSTYLTAKGSARARLVWLGLLVYSAYTYAIYVFAINFGYLFLVWVAIFGMSVYALIAELASIDVGSLSRHFPTTTRTKFPSRLLMAIGSIFFLLWLSEIIPATLSGSKPDALQDVGLATNPVHVLDLAIFLPALIISGWLLSKRRPLGYVLAPMMLVATFFLALGILSLMAVSAYRDLDADPGVAIAVGLMTLLEAAAVVHLLRRSDPDT